MKREQELILKLKEEIMWNSEVNKLSEEVEDMKTDIEKNRKIWLNRYEKIIMN